MYKAMKFGGKEFRLYIGLNDQEGEQCVLASSLGRQSDGVPLVIIQGRKPRLWVAAFFRPFARYSTTERATFWSRVLVWRRKKDEHAGLQRLAVAYRECGEASWFDFSTRRIIGNGVAGDRIPGPKIVDKLVREAFARLDAETRAAL